MTRWSVWWLKLVGLAAASARRYFPGVDAGAKLSMILVGMLLWPAGVSAQNVAQPEIVGVRVGFAGHYKVGLWTPVEVTLHGGGLLNLTVSLTVPDGDGVPSRVFGPLPDGASSVLLYARFGRIDSRLGVELHRHDRVIGRRVFTTTQTADDSHFLPAVASARKLIVSIGTDPLGVEDAAALVGQNASGRPVVVRLDDVGQLPDRWYGYEGVDALVFSTSRPEIFDSGKLTTEQIAALNEWIELGGKLVLCVGSQAEAVLAKGSPLGRFTPGRLERMFSLRQTGALETYAGSSIPVPRPAGGARLSLRVPQLVDIEGVVEAREADLPLVVRTPQGFGQIVFLAVELDRPPLGNWKDRPLLAARLLGLPAVGSERSADSSAVMHYGFNDMSGQLRSALDQFPSVWLVPFSLVVGLIVLYVLAIGPADYFFLRRVARRMLWRMQWTWVTFPAVVLVFSLVAYGLAYWLKGDRLWVNQVDLVDVDTTSGRVRGTSWLNIFSPRTETFNLSLQSILPDGKPAADARVLFSWLGLSGEALGGMDPRTSNPLLWTEPYDFSRDLSAMLGVPIQVWSTRSFTARWTDRTRLGLQAVLIDEGQVPSGTITNTLGFPLSHCLLACNRWVYELDTLQPGESFRLGPMVKRQELKTLLTGRKTVFDDTSEKYREQSTPYDQSSIDVPYILRAMMFFEAAGGRRYTGLSNGYQGFVDLSSLLKTNRAILVGQGPADRPGAELLRDGRPMTHHEDQHLTFYRFVFPVEKKE